MFISYPSVQTSSLKLNKPNDYLSWAAQVFDVQVNPDLNDNERGRQAQMLGTYRLYIDLLTDLQKNGLDKEYSEISSHGSGYRPTAANEFLRTAMTEHFFDNAGFGPAAGALP